MLTPQFAILALVIGAFSIFGGVLGFASWEETRTRRHRERK